jgi:hypothetical protein
MKKKKVLPGPYAALTKDTRFAGTYEVLVPDSERVKPHRIPLQFESHEEAESWIHSPDGVEAITQLLHRRPQ